MYIVKSMLAVAFLVLFITTGYSQLGKKLTIGVYAGFAKGTGTETYSPTGLSQNIFSSYGTGALGGLNVLFSNSKRFEFGLDIHGTSVSKSNSKLNLLSVGPQIQFNILPSDKNIVPYLAGAFNISFVQLYEDANNSTFYPSSSSGSGNSLDVQITSIQNQTPSMTLGLNGVLGYKLNAGVNIKLNTRLWCFAEGGYNSVIMNGNSTIEINFPESTGNFNYINGTIGVKLNLLKSTGLY